MAQIESKVDLAVVAGILGTEVRKGPRGIRYASGPDATGRMVSLEEWPATNAVQVLSIGIANQGGEVTDRTNLINGQITNQPDGGIIVEDVKSDRFTIGPGLPAAIHHCIR